MIAGGSLIERSWRGLVEAKWEGVFGGLNLIGGTLIRPSTAQCQSGRPVRFRGRTNERPVSGSFGSAPWGAPISSVAGFWEGLASIPLLMVERFFDVFGAAPFPQTPTGRCDCVTVQRPAGYSGPVITPSPASQIVEQADAFLSSIPGEGALLSDLVENVALNTGYDEATVRSVVLRNFSWKGQLVWKANDGQSGGSTVDQMKAALQRLSYVDLREDYALTAIPSRNDRAALLAFDGIDPAVLCYPVGPGEVCDPMIREAALFQAGAVAPNQTAHFVWVSDGMDDFFYDFRARVVISQLPARQAPVVQP